MILGDGKTASAVPALGLEPRISTHRRGWRGAATLTAVFLLFLSLIVILQLRAGSYSCEFSGYPDEPAHYISSLMVRDYMTAGHLSNPVRYAENYYLHYPKVSFGMWGPLFHVLGGFWLLASSGRTSIMLLMAVVVAALATTLYRVVRQEFPAEAGLAAGAALLVVPAVQYGASMVMGDNLCALLDFWACIAFARYLESEKARDSILFGVVAAMSILAKPSGLALALVPPLGILLTRRLELLRTRAFWYPVGIVLVLCGPWQLLEFRLLNGMQREMNLGWSITLLRYVMHTVGIALYPWMLFGIAVKFVRPLRTEPPRTIWTVVGIMALAVWMYHFLLPVGAAEMRYMIPVLPPLMMFLIAGIYWMAARLPLGNLSTRAKAAALMMATAGLFAAQTFAIPHKHPRGFEEAADALEARADFRDAVFMVSSESDGEGLLISEIAMRDAHRPGHIVLRAAKVLGQSDWQRNRYKLLYSTPEQIMQYLDRIPVRVVIMERGGAWYTSEHHAILLQALQTHPERCRLIGTYTNKTPGAAADSRIEIYELLGQPNRPPGKIRIEMPYTWGKPIEN